MRRTQYIYIWIFIQIIKITPKFIPKTERNIEILFQHSIEINKYSYRLLNFKYNLVWMNKIMRPVYVSLSLTSNIDGIYYSRIVHVQFALYYTYILFKAMNVPFKAFTFISH